MPDLPKLLSLSETARILRTSPARVKDLVASQALPAALVAGRLKFRAADVERLLQPDQGDGTKDRKHGN